MRVRRFDIGGLEKPIKEPNGWARVDAYLARTGLQRYLTADGKERIEYRPPDEVFNADSLKSFEAVPFTNDHPPEPLDATNTSKYQKGHLVGAPRQDGEKMRATILVTDAATIADMEAGKLEISNGYFAELDETPGTLPDGQRYDAIQRSITGNHVALVDRGRAGPDVRVRMDATDAVMIPSQQTPIRRESAADSQPIRNEAPMKKIRIDGIEVEVSEQTAQLFEKAQAASAAALTEATTKAEKAAARADGLEKELKDAKTALAEAPAKARADIEARIKLEGVARRVLGAEVKVDGVDAADLRRQIAATEAPEGVKLEEKTDAYVEVLFDKAVAKLDEKKAVDDVLEKTKPVELPVEKPATLIEAAAQMFKTGKVIR